MLLVFQVCSNNTTPHTFSVENQTKMNVYIGRRGCGKEENVAEGVVTRTYGGAMRVSKYGLFIYRDNL